MAMLMYALSASNLCFTNWPILVIFRVVVKAAFVRLGCIAKTGC